MCRSLLQELGLVVGTDVRLEINSLGQPDERSAHRAGLIAYLEQHADASTRIRGAGCTPTRCASSTARTRRCRRSPTARRG
jgi:hypothetical protein